MAELLILIWEALVCYIFGCKYEVKGTYEYPKSKTSDLTFSVTNYVCRRCGQVKNVNTISCPPIIIKVDKEIHND